ncbi:MAG: NAD(P)/FAD-dependent oxidoreductase [Ruminococcaceae bacterium]|nr:NAD(P)/FAD-dependent oxidoreductase [Oscillospiraceae bacterium]
MAIPSYDVVIIGAGISGAITAYQLAKYNVKVAVLEAGIDAASGSTRANSAIVHAGYDAKEGTLKAQLNVKGCEMMEELTKSLGVHYSKCGSLVIGYTDKDLEHLKLLKSRGEKNGVPDLEIIDKDRLHQMEPMVSDDANYALWAPSAGIVCPYDLAYALCENAVTNGTKFYFEFKVSKIDYDGEYYTLCCGKKKVKSKYVVNAAGLFVDEIAGMLGEKLPFDIIPRRGEYMLLDKCEIKTASHTLFVTPSEKGKGILISPTVDGNIIVGPNANVVDSKVDTSVTEEGLEEIAEGAKRIVPDIKLESTITTFAGVRATPTSGDFYIQESERFKNFVHVAGIESPGLASAPAIGIYVLDILKGCGLALTERKNYISTRTKNGNCKQFYEMDEEERVKAIESNPSYAKILCRCEMVTEGDVIDALHRPIPAHTLDMVKRRTRAGMGRCQGNYCRARIAELIAEEFDIPLSEVKKFTSNSNILYGKTK